MIDITQVPIGTIVHGRDIGKAQDRRYVSHACMDCQQPRWVPVHNTTTASTMHNSPQRCSRCDKAARRARVTRWK